MKTIMKGLILAGGSALLALAPSGSLAARQLNPNPTTITVENPREVPVGVYLERGSYDTRLGTIPPHRTMTLDLPPFLVEGEAVQIFVHPEGGPDLNVKDLQIRPGQHATLRVSLNDAEYVSTPLSDMTPTPTIEGSTTITVENNRPVKVWVFLEGGETDTRLGMVPAHEERTLTIPDWLTKESPNADIFVHPEGEGDLASWTMTLSPGAHLRVRVPGGEGGR